MGASSKGQVTHRQIAVRRSRFGLFAVGLFAFAICAGQTANVRAGRLDEMSVDRWKKLRETERYQLNIAEKYYRAQRNWKVAAAEYEKYLTLYERSDGAPYAQLMWSICQSNLKNKHTAIKEGFQSVIDYWPESPDAVSAAYYIGLTYKQIGEVRKAKKAYQKVLADYSKHPVTVFAMNELVDISVLEKDLPSRIVLWKKLTFESKRTSGRDVRNICEKASRDLAVHSYNIGAFGDGVKALETTYLKPVIVANVVANVRGPITTQVADTKSKAKADKLADLAISYVVANTPSDTSTPEKRLFAIQHWFHVVDINVAAGRTTKVPPLYDQITKKFGADDGILGRLAGWWKTQKQYDKARQIYGRFKNKIEGQSQIAISYRNEARIEPAVLAYRKLMLDDAENTHKWNAQIAATYDENRQYKKAIEVYLQLMKEDIEQADKWRWAAAYDYERSGQHKEAIGYYRQCSNFPSNYQRMAGCHIALKQYGEAIVLYNQIVGGAPSSAPWASLQIGYTLERAGKKELAIRQFQLVCKRFPKDGHASQAHAHLQNKYKITATLGGAKSED
jgi:tetratricopeptide (TPR) repeat protein